jgi:hypothetical protein
MRRSKLKSLLKDTWAFEIIAFSVSLLALGCLTYLLRYYDQQPIFKWYGLTLNTIVSTISTISKTLQMFTVSACISQWKYIAFSKNKKKLIDFERLDSASRGPQGSFTLLWTTQLRYAHYSPSFARNSC